MDKQDIRAYWLANLLDGVEAGQITYHNISRFLDDLTDLTENLLDKTSEQASK